MGTFRHFLHLVEIKLGTAVVVTPAIHLMLFSIVSVNIDEIPVSVLGIRFSRKEAQIPHVLIVIPFSEAVVADNKRITGRQVRTVDI